MEVSEMEEAVGTRGICIWNMRDYWCALYARRNGDAQRFFSFTGVGIWQFP